MSDFHVAVDSARTVGARLYRAGGTARLSATLILGHGAGAGQASPFMVKAATGLSARGITVATFDFPYIQARRRVPDTNATLEATWRAVVSALVERGAPGGDRLFIGGKSMGGRIASQVAALPEQLPVAIEGLVFLGYPLHPPGRVEQRRDAHLPDIASPMLFVQGERDAFGNAEEMRALVTRLPRAELFIVEGADHSLAIRKATPGNHEAILAAVLDHVAAWMSGVVSAG
jgi:hypothetical protein